MTAAAGAGRYRDARRRLLVDMHIPDWDDGFLARYEPGDMAGAASLVGADAVMLYFQSHLGLCYYPTQVGVRHRAAESRDLAGETLDALAANGLPVCAYYSVNFNNRAWLDHPDWRLQPAAPATVGVLPRERYGIVCMNNPAYRDFVAAQIAEIAAYQVDAFFFDMVWWNGICTCTACRDRFRNEAGTEIPELIDWSSPAWCQFQAARERWLTELAIWLRERARLARPGADVYHNFALGLSNWTRGVTFSSIAGHDFLGGDFYGGRAEQLLITRLMLNLTPNRPAEFMTTVASGLTEHSRLRSYDQLRVKALAALLADAAFLAIVAIDPDGTIDPQALDRVRAAFETSRRFDTVAGGEPIEDIGIYCSDLSKLDVDRETRAIQQAPAASLPDYPHFEALVGACRIVQQAHIPFGIVSRANLAELSRWPVIVLPNVQRMDAAEVAALRAYVRGGGRLYASRASSLHGVEGGPATDFQLADLFGCTFECAEQGRLVYARATGWPQPERPLAHWRDVDGKTGTLRVRLNGGEGLVAMTLPYGHPHPGTVSDQDWASIHSSPPWEATDRPLVVRNRFGAGVSIYSAFDMEAGQSPEHDALFLSLLRDLMPEPPRVEGETHPHLWLSAFEQPKRLVVYLLNYQLEEPALPVPDARIRVRIPQGRRCLAVRRAPGFDLVSHLEIEPGLIEFMTGSIDQVAVHVIDLSDPE